MALVAELPSLTPSHFYGGGLPRPMMYIHTSSTGDNTPASTRVDPPQLLGGLMDWALKAHWSMGGMAVKRRPYMGKIPGSQKMIQEQLKKAAGDRKQTQKAKARNRKSSQLAHDSNATEGKRSTVRKAASAKNWRYAIPAFDSSSEDEGEAAQVTVVTPARVTASAATSAEMLSENEPGRRQTRSQTAVTVEAPLVAITPTAATTLARKMSGSTPGEEGMVTPHCPITVIDYAPRAPAARRPAELKERLKAFDLSDAESDGDATETISKRGEEAQTGNASVTHERATRKGKRKVMDGNRSTSSDQLSLELFSPSTRRARLARRGSRGTDQTSQRVGNRSAKLAISFASVHAALLGEGPGDGDGDGDGEEDAAGETVQEANKGSSSGKR